MNEDQFKKVVSHCKEYGFIFPSSEVYDGLNGVYDYGQNGVLLKNNLKEYWWKAMVQLNDNIVGIDSAIFMHPKIWKASGHVDAFNDPMIDNKDSKKRYRADNLIEEHITKIEDKIAKEVEKAAKRFGETFDEALYRSTNPRLVEYKNQIDTIEKRLAEDLRTNNMADLKALIEELEIVCPVSGSRNWTEVRQFSLMFSTQMSNVTDGGDDKLYLRPETAQGIFVNFNNVQKTSRQKLPFGIAQIGKAFRNEIVARQFIFRMREFEQMEMQFFVTPGTQKEWYENWKNKRMAWHLAIGTPADKLRFKDHDNLAFYADAAVDIQFDFPFGFKELEGIHSRTDYDLGSHQKLSGKKLQYFDPETKESFVPYVVETSIGLDRLFLAMMGHNLQEDLAPDEDGKETSRTVLKLHPALAPVKCAVLPLVKNKPELVEVAEKLYRDLKTSFLCVFDEKDSVGKRYRRQDAVGTPFCVTVDFESLEDGCATVRDRDTLQQERIPFGQIGAMISEKVDMRRLLEKL